MRKAIAAVAAVAVVGGGAVAVTQLTGTSADGGWKGSMNSSYQAAAAGATIEVPAGTLTPDFPAEGAVKILPASKATTDPVTFVCKGDGDVIFPEGQLVITARNVVIRGGCFKMRKLWIGDPANGVSTANVTVDGVSMQIFDISGSDKVTVKNSDVGPSVASSANRSYNEPKIHDGGPGGQVPPTNVVLDNVTIHDMQTADPNQYHTGGLWLGWGINGSVAIRNSRFLRNAIYDIHIDTPAAWNLTLDGNTFAAPVLPQSQGTGPAPASFSDLQLKCQNGQLVKNYTITGNTWVNGWNLVYGGCTGATYAGLTITGNTGGSTRNPAETASVPPPVTTTEPTPPPVTTTEPTPPPVTTTEPTPPPVTTTEPTPPPVTTTEPPSCGAPVLGWKLPTRATITVTWPLVPGATGYRLSKNGVAVSTASAKAVSAKFGSLPYAATTLGVAAICPDGDKKSSLVTTETRTAN